MWIRCLLSLVLLCLCACQSTTGERRTLVVASDLDNLPFAGVADDGTPIGRDVEMMRELCRRAGFDLEWSRMPFDRLLPSVENGKVDAVCATLGITAERAHRVLFSDPYYDTEIAVVVRVGDGEPRSLRDLTGKRVSGGVGTTSERAIKNQLHEAVGVFENKEGVSAMYRLLTRDIDGAVMDGPAAAKLVVESSGKLRRLGTPLARERYALALPKSHAEVLAGLNAALQQMRESGALRALNRRHGL